jgi:hypothetical protein
MKLNQNLNKLLKQIVTRYKKKKVIEKNIFSIGK